MKKNRILMALVALTLVMGLTAGLVSADSTTKPLATNYSLVNLSPNDTSATVNYYLQDGSEWKPADVLPIPGNGGQVQIRQYADPDLSAGSGSAVVSSLEPLAGLVQVVVPASTGAIPTSGAYTAISEGSSVYYIPQVAKNGSSATGIMSAWIIIQNLGASPVDVDVVLTKYGSATPEYTKSITGIAPGVSYYYDLDNETNITDGFYSAVVDAGTGMIGVVANLFFGSDGLMAVNAFPQEALTDAWAIPMLFSRLPNSLVTSLLFQNLSGVEIPAGDIVLSCTPDPASVDQSSIDTSNANAVPVNGVQGWNTLSQTSIFPANWYGPCTVTSTSGKGLVGIIQYRFSANSNMSAYEAIPMNSTDTSVFVPLIAKRLTNKFCTVVTFVNLSSTDITVDLTWTHSAESPFTNDYTETDVAIPGYGSFQRNLCMADQPIGLSMPDRWIGTVSGVGTGPLAAYTQNRYNPATGDQYQAYLGITQP